MGRKCKLLEGRITFKAPAKGYPFTVVTFINSVGSGELIEILKACEREDYALFLRPKESADATL